MDDVFWRFQSHAMNENWMQSIAHALCTKQYCLWKQTINTDSNDCEIDSLNGRRDTYKKDYLDREV